ncbi:MAG TPA: DUF362 domain-containing protein [Nitrospiraceae bacterium]|nr:DUF362 domain-containing protein [Nitrospiraceae bacterium]
MIASRRDLLSRLGFGLTFLPAVALAPRSLVGSLLFEPDGELVPAKPIPSNPFTRDGKALVAMVHGQDPTAMLRVGLELIGGIKRLGLRGKRVLIKPNIVNDRPPPTTTSPSVITAVVRVIREAEAAEVVVADSSGIIRFPTSNNLVTTGVRSAAEAVGARVMALEDEPWVRVEPAGAKSLPRFYVSKPVYDADAFINLPVVKTHRFAHYSCSLKNLVGITHPRYRPSVTFLAGDWHERIAELNLAVHPQLTIADATTIMIAGGPTSGTPARADLLLLSGDRVALDAVGVALIRSFGAWPKVEGMSVWEQRQIKKSIELGLGATGPDQIALVTQSVSGPDAGFEKLVTTIRRDLMRS